MLTADHESRCGAGPLAEFLLEQKVLARFGADRVLDLEWIEWTLKWKASRELTRQAVHKLAARGCLQPLPQQHYRIVPHATITTAALDTTILVRLARPALQRLRQQSGCTTTLTILDGTAALRIDEVTAPNSRPPPEYAAFWPTGRRRYAQRSAAGLALLAHLQPRQQRALANLLLDTGREEAGLRERTRLLHLLAGVRRDGYALVYERWIPQLRCLAVAIHDPDEHPIAAITLTAPSMTLNKQAAVSHLKDRLSSAAAQITAGLPPLPPQHKDQLIPGYRWQAPGLAWDIYTLREQGMTIAEITRRLGVSRWIANKALQRSGYVTPTNTELEQENDVGSLESRSEDWSHCDG